MDSVRPSNSEVLRAKIELTCGSLGCALDNLWSHPELPDRFPRFLVLLHQIMRASVPLMEFARDAALERRDSDPAAAGLAEYFAHHIDEERNHDVWTLEDLVAAGFDGEAVLAQLPPPALAAMVGSQYYWILHHHPAALLGYIAILEGNPPNQAHIDRLQAETGLPVAAFRTYRMHGRLDPHHRDELYRVIDELPLTPALAGLISTSATHTAQMLAWSLDGLDCIAHPPRTGERQAA